MNTLQKIGIAGVGLVIGVGVTSATVYQSIFVSKEAKTRVALYATLLKLPQRDMASKMILEWVPNAIEWYPNSINSSFIQINLIREVSKNPHRFELVKEITPSTENDGVYEWTPGVGERGIDMYIEIGCKPTPQECRALPPIPFK